MKKKFLTTLLSLCMLLFLAQMTALAADGLGVEAILVSPNGSIHYAGQLSLTQWRAQSGDTIILQQDVNVPYGLNFRESNITLDLNGKTLQSNISVAGSKQFTIKDSSAASIPAVSSDHTVTYESGKIVSQKSPVEVQGTLTLESGIIEACGDSAGVVVKNGSIVNLNGGYIHSETFGVLVQEAHSTINVQGSVIESEDHAAVGGNESNDSGETTINISGGHLIGHSNTRRISRLRCVSSPGWSAAYHRR